MRMVAAIAAVAMLAFGATTASAAELKVLVSNALKSTMEEAVPDFEKTSGHKLSITFGAAAELKAAIEKGAPVDAAILTTATTDDLIKEGKLVAAGRADIARSGAGVAVRRGARKPDISTTAGFKQALLDAKSIGFVGAGATAPYIRSLFDKLGIAEEVKGKLKVLPATNPAANAVANGEAEIGITQISEILPYPGAELVGPLPSEIQLYTVYPAAVAADTKEPAAANALIKYLTTPAAIAVLKSKGLNPG
jgi:molybdate transport system substrate-binding protein